MNQTLKIYAQAEGRRYLLQEWDTLKNLPLTPDACAPGSHRKVWWRCTRGHSWQAAVKSRVSGTNCPVCANRVVVAGENDLATLRPELARQWDWSANAPLGPDAVTAGTNRKVWWHCERGHTWQAAVSARVRGSGCPVCAGKQIIPQENDLATRFPDIAVQWHPTKNQPLTPQTCSPSSNRKVWWCCPRGHEYQAAVGARTVNGSDCPYCSGHRALAGFNDLATLVPEVAASWHPTLNAPLTPQDVTIGSRRKVWWICPLGHVWKAVIYSRAGPRRCGCPVCAGRVSASQQIRYTVLLAEKETRSDIK